MPPTVVMGKMAFIFPLYTIRVGHRRASLWRQDRRRGRRERSPDGLRRRDRVLSDSDRAGYTRMVQEPDWASSRSLRILRVIHSYETLRICSNVHSIKKRISLQGHYGSLIDLNGTFGEAMWKGEAKRQAPEDIPKKSERATLPWRWGQGYHPWSPQSTPPRVAVAACVSSASCLSPSPRHDRRVSRLAACWRSAGLARRWPALARWESGAAQRPPRRCPGGACPTGRWHQSLGMASPPQGLRAHGAPTRVSPLSALTPQHGSASACARRLQPSHDNRPRRLQAQCIRPAPAARRAAGGLPCRHPHSPAAGGEGRLRGTPGGTRARDGETLAGGLA
jgi:hypothetical protein